MISEKDIRRFSYGDKHLKQFLRPQLKEEVNDINSWLPEYEQYYNVNPQDIFISKLVQEGKERLKILEVLLEQDFYERIWKDNRERCSQCGWILQESYGCYMSFLVCKNPVCRTRSALSEKKWQEERERIREIQNKHFRGKGESEDAIEGRAYFRERPEKPKKLIEEAKK